MIHRSLTIFCKGDLRGRVHHLPKVTFSAVPKGRFLAWQRLAHALDGYHSFELPAISACSFQGCSFLN